jgi:hypothetical protein
MTHDKSFAGKDVNLDMEWVQTNKVGAWLKQQSSNHNSKISNEANGHQRLKDSAVLRAQSWEPHTEIRYDKARRLVSTTMFLWETIYQKAANLSSEQLYELIKTELFEKRPDGRRGIDTKQWKSRPLSILDPSESGRSAACKATAYSGELSVIFSGLKSFAGNHMPYIVVPSG